MNLKERQMLDILKSGKENYGFNGVKAEFEAEGTRTDELLRLVEIARKADVKLAVKIGGCEAMRDLMEVKQIGVDYVIAPMVETSYALWKYIDAKNKIFTKEEQQDTKFLANLETITSFNNIDSIVEKASSQNGVDGLVFGRVDFSMSLGKSGREGINGDDITDYVLRASQKCKDNNLEFVVGGGISIDALETLKKINSVHLNRFETRKIIFNSTCIDSSEKGLLNAISFELLWLKNKRDYYGSIFAEDDKRIEMLESRWKKLV